MGKSNCPTPGGAAAADLLLAYGSAESTWKNRICQLRKWLLFCDEEGRLPLPATEGDILAYIGYLAAEGRVGPSSAKQYLPVISRLHRDAGILSPTREPFVSSLLKAYENCADALGDYHITRIGFNASTMREIVRKGC